MDTSEASIAAFSIGPSTLVGRTVALRILLHHSAQQLRLRLLDAFHHLRYNALPMVASCFHPKNSQGILFTVIMAAFLLKWLAGARTRAALAQWRSICRNIMRCAATYEEWAHAAKMLDKMSEQVNEADFYDEELVRSKLEELRRRREEGSLRDVVFYMRGDLMRNLGNMCNPELHKGRLQVPKLIKDYIDEVSTQLKMVRESDSDELLLEEKLSFVQETRHAFGRTALLLSGGASLGAFHVGVVKTLVEHKLLPRIIAGSSAGSIVCAIVATRSWPEIESFFKDSLQSLQFFDQIGGVFAVVKRVMTYGAIHEISQMQRLLRDLTSNLTFQEAYDMTGRILGITVCSPRKNEPPRCLNYLTSPHVVIWSAVTASCAFPGLFEAQELMAKNRFGQIVPFHASFSTDVGQGLGTSKRRWRDGSLEIDLPMMQLKELFNVNHFIVSQTNPHISPILRLKELIRTYGGKFAGKLAHLAEMEVKHRCNQILEIGLPLGGIAKLFAQDWEGDVTVVVPATLAQYSKIIQNPSFAELQKAANQGRRCTWEKLSAIKANCAIELALDESVALLNHKRRLKRSAAKAAASPGYTYTVRSRTPRRVPSWSCITRENSSGSLSEDILGVHQGTIRVGEASNTSHHVRCNSHDRSDSESGIIDQNSWTRYGGPLMRTASADEFINFIQNIEIESVFDRTCFVQDEAPSRLSAPIFFCNNSGVTTPDRSAENTDTESCNTGNSRGTLASSTSIMVSEGDFLQPEKINNGILLNIVRKEAVLELRNSESEQAQSSFTEAGIDNTRLGSSDAVSASDCVEDGEDEDTDFRTSDQSLVGANNVVGADDA